MSKPKKQLANPSITFENEINPMIEAIENLELKSIGFVRVPEKNTYVSYVLTTKGDKVLSIDFEEPNVKGIAEESSKIAFVNNFCNEQ